LLDLRPLLLVVSALLLAFSAVPKRLELVRHLLDRPSEIGELARDGRYVLLGCHPRPILWPRVIETTRRAKQHAVERLRAEGKHLERRSAG
jgi:hypothetical protein